MYYFQIYKMSFGKYPNCAIPAPKPRVCRYMCMPWASKKEREILRRNAKFMQSFSLLLSIGQGLIGSAPVHGNVTGIFLTLIHVVNLLRLLFILGNPFTGAADLGTTSREDRTLYASGLHENGQVEPGSRLSRSVKVVSPTPLRQGTAALLLILQALTFICCPSRDVRNGESVRDEVVPEHASGRRRRGRRRGTRRRAGRRQCRVDSGDRSHAFSARAGDSRIDID
jgi:hypothetical protein